MHVTAVEQDVCTRLLRCLPPVVQAAFDGVSPRERAIVEEIRIARGRPVMVRVPAGDLFVTPTGCSRDASEAVHASEDMVEALLAAVTHSSVYAVEEAMREGFLSLPGGHRVGLVGTVKVDAGRIVGYRHVAGFCIRLNRPVRGAASGLLPRIVTPQGGVHSTLIVSPPGCGKTTLLRDLIRRLSYGDPSFGLKPHRVGVADERSEIAASYRGVSQNDLGPRTDVIDQCPKRLALSLLLRAMGPQVLATDEVGHPGDVAALLDAAGAGVGVVCTAHGDSLEALWHRPTLRPVLESGLFARIALLSRRKGPGTLEAVVPGGRQP